MENMKHLVPLFVLCLGLVACGPTNTSSEPSASSPKDSTSEKTPDSSKPADSSKPESSSEKPAASSSSEPAAISSSEEPVTSFSDTEEPASSSEPPSTAITKSIDFTALIANKTLVKAGASGKVGNYDADDGFFYAKDVSFDSETAASQIKTGGAGVIKADKLDHVIYFTTTGAGTIKVTGKSGSTGCERRLYLVKEGTAQGDFSAEGVQVGTYDVNNAKKTVWVDSTFNLPTAGKYYLISNEGYTIKTLSVTYDPSLAQGTANNTTVTLASSNSLDAELLYPGKIANNAVYGDFTFTSTDSEVMFKSKVKDTKVQRNNEYRYNFIHLKSGDKIKFTANDAGTATMSVAYAASATAEDGTTAVNTTVTLTDGTTPVTKTLQDETGGIQNLTFAISAATYTLSADHDIYFQALSVATL